MRDMTAVELEQFYEHGRCPFCNHGAFLNGPEGGLMQNIECCGCGARINIMPGPCLGYPPVPPLTATTSEG